MPAWLTHENIRWVFRGRDGLRAGWSLLIFLALIGAVGAIAGLVIVLLHGKPPKPPTGELSINLLLLSESIQGALIIGVTAIMMRFERRPLAFYGFSPMRAGQQFAYGLAWGLAMLSTVVGVLWASGLLVFDGVNGSLAAAIPHGLVMAAGFVMVGIAEETFTRGYLLATLSRGIGFWPAASVTSLLFAAGHLGNTGESVIGVAQVFVAGMVFCALLRWSGALWLPIGFHAAWDWAQSFLYGTADSGLMFKGRLLNSHAVGNVLLSGGPTGPEASLLTTPLLLAGLFAMMVWLRGTERRGAVAA